MQKFFEKFKFFCLTFCVSLSLVLMIVLFRQKLVSDNGFKMTYPEVVFVNNVSIDKNLAVSSLRDLITPYLTGDKLMDIDIQSLFNEIRGLSWVQDVAVVRDFPDVLKLLIKSKNVIAYKVSGDAYFPITDKGEVINLPVEYNNGILVFGDFAEESFPELLKFLSFYPFIMEKLVAVQFINGLRWNLILFALDERGLTIKLDNEYFDGIKKLAELDLFNGILSKNISEIDLRDLDKILIKQRSNYGL